MIKFFTKKLILIYTLVIFFGFTGGYFYYVYDYKIHPKEKLIQYNLEQNKQKDVLAKKLLPNSKLIFETKYLGNGQTIKEEQKLNYSLYGKSEDEISRIYSGWEVKKFSEEEIFLYREKQGFPADYYIISNIGGYVCLLKSDGNEGTELIEKTDITVESLTPYDRERVLKKIITNSKDEAYQILANLSS